METINNSYRELCYSHPDDECVKSDIFGVCQECSSGYYLSDNKLCIENPDEKVSNCSVYNPALECVTCETNFYLHEMQCKPFPSDHVNKCVTLVRAGDNFSCSECLPNLIPENDLCVARTNIEFCLTYVDN